MAQTVKIDGLADAVMDALMEYQEEVSEGTKKAVQKVSRECAREIRTKAPQDSGTYAKSWTVKRLEENESEIHMVIYSKNRYQLAHLLEYGHVLKNKDGRVLGTVGAKPHIRPAELNAEKKLMKEVKVVVTGGKA